MTTNKKTYQGSCHCGAIKFEVDMALDHVRVCDCSICVKRGALNFRVGETDLRIIKGEDKLSLYQWHTRIAKDYFCPDCGILPFRRPRTAANIWTINIRCLDDVDLNSLPIKRVYGKKLT